MQSTLSTLQQQLHDSRCFWVRFYSLTVTVATFFLRIFDEETHQEAAKKKYNQRKNKAKDKKVGVAVVGVLTICWCYFLDIFSAHLMNFLFQLFF